MDQKGKRDFLLFSLFIKLLRKLEIRFFNNGSIKIFGLFFRYLLDDISLNRIENIDVDVPINILSFNKKMAMLPSNVSKAF